MAPFAGVLFLLVIFLLLNSTLVFTPGVRIQLPTAQGQPLPGLDAPSVVVAMDLGGQMFFENQVIQENALRERLAREVALHTNLVMVIQADKSVELAAFFKLGKLAAEAGLREVLLAAQPAGLTPVQP